MQALITQVANGGSIPAISFDSATASSNVTNTWAQGNSGAFFGIFGSSDSTTSQLTEVFTSSRVTATISFQKRITFVADPPPQRLVFLRRARTGSFGERRRSPLALGRQSELEQHLRP